MKTPLCLYVTGLSTAIALRWCTRGASVVDGCLVAGANYSCIARTCGPRNTNAVMVVGLLITGCVGFLAVGATFATIIYLDARAERRRP